MSSLADLLVQMNWDTVGAASLNGQPRTDVAKEDIVRVTNAVKHAARYRFSPEAIQFVLHISETLGDRPGAVEQINMPAGLCFFEMPWENADAPGHRARQGLLFIGRLPLSEFHKPAWDEETFQRTLTEGSTTEGSVVIIAQNDSGGMMFTSGYLNLKQGKAVTNDLDQPDTGVFFRIDRATADDLISQIGEEGAASYIDYVGFLTAAFGMVLTSPKVIETREQDVTRLNKARVKSGKRPLLSHKDVLITLPRVAPARADTVQPVAEPRRGKVKHFVNVFTRLKRGKIEVVSPHWRGDEALGVKMPSYFAKGKN